MNGTVEKYNHRYIYLVDLKLVIFYVGGKCTKNIGFTCYDAK